jgi:ABC-type bacteriocin/lantibiotic exporter with double-glycine peptidase domain
MQTIQRYLREKYNNNNNNNNNNNAILFAHFSVFTNVTADNICNYFRKTCNYKLNASHENKYGIIIITLFYQGSDCHLFKLLHLFIGRLGSLLPFD